MNTPEISPPRATTAPAEGFCIHAVMPNYYDESRVGYSMKSIVDAMASPTIRTCSYVLGRGKNVHDASVSALLPTWLYAYTSKLVRKPCESIVARFRHRMKQGDVAYLWLSNPPAVTQALQRRGLWVVREMINCTLERSREELRHAHRILGLPERTTISDADIAQERADLLSADAVFCPNEHVYESVMAYGVASDRCLRTSYGWTEARIHTHSEPMAKGVGTTFLFVGSGDVRKGFPWVLEAWAQAGAHGRLLLAGLIEPGIRERYAAILSRPDVVELGYVEDIGAVYRSADVFCFPSWEEGGPMVTIEAMGAGLACIVTPMGSAGLLSESSGAALIVLPGDTAALGNAMRQMAADDVARRRMAQRARDIAADYTWQRVGKRRAEAIISLRLRAVRV